MISIFLLAAMAAGAPIEARVTGVDLQEPVGAGAMPYNRIRVELESAQGQNFRVCPGDVSVVTDRRVRQGFARVDRSPAYAMSLGEARNQSGSCREIVLAPGRPQIVVFYVTGVPGRPYHGENHFSYSIVLNLGSSSLPVPQG